MQRRLKPSLLLLQSVKAVNQSYSNPEIRDLQQWSLKVVLILVTGARTWETEKSIA